tara:strand:- start:408 stop:602 length:195 start_codon:yes stop_codon:yes gene_type:complete
MSVPARIAFVLALAALIAAVALWWSGGAWQYGAFPTRGLVRAAAFALGAFCCIGVSAWIRQRLS